MATVAPTLRFDGELAGQLMARAPRWVMGALVVLLGVRAALLVADLSAPAAAEMAPVAPAVALSRNVVDLPSILRSNLFGQSAAAAGPAVAPATAMALVLGGVIADSDEKRGYAMIGTSAADIKLFKVGDVTPGGARLHAVYVDRVLLDRGGTIESLPMPQRISAVLSGPPPPVTPLASASVERVQQMMRDNPGMLGTVIQRTAVFADGKLRGMRVNPGSNPAAFARLGLRPGDLVTAINGTPLDDQTRSEEVFGTLASAAEARVTVIRNNSQQDLLLNLADVAREAEKLAQSPPPDQLPPEAGRPALPSAR